MSIFHTDKATSLAETAEILNLPFKDVICLLTESLGLGILLAIITIISVTLVSKFITPNSQDGKTQATLQEIILGSANMVFLCVSLTALMIIVDNNLARAFAIGAAVALIRFRGKLAGKASDTSLLFAVLCGMSLGVAQTPLACLIVGMFFVIQCLLVISIYLSK